MSQEERILEDVFKATPCNYKERRDQVVDHSKKSSRRWSDALDFCRQENRIVDLCKDKAYES